jgi:hypothetical protein
MTTCAEPSSPTIEALQRALAAVGEALQDCSASAALRLEKVVDVLSREILVAGGDPTSLSPGPFPRPIRPAVTAPPPAASSATATAAPCPPLAKTARCITMFTVKRNGHAWPSRMLRVPAGDLAAAAIMGQFVTVQIYRGRIEIVPTGESSSNYGSKFAADDKR